MNVNLLKYNEHFEGAIKPEDCACLTNKDYNVFFKKKRGDDLPCFTIKADKDRQSFSMNTGYFIGVDWLEKNKSAIFIAPKLNTNKIEINFVRILFSSLKHSEVSKEIDELFEVKWDEPKITIEQKEDLLTPFLVIEFLGLLKNIVRKGLKKSYYKVEKNLNSRIKGKVLIAKTLKENLLQNKPLYTYCSYEEFGLNNKENRLLKKALTFIKRYLPTYAELGNSQDLQNTFNYINPAFDEVSEEIELNDIKHSKMNVFYKDYEQALKLAKLILRRFGYSITNTVKKQVNIPPFWIDMSKLFELYVLGLLKDRFNKQIKFHYSTYGNELDYLLNTPNYKMVIDAKYKLKYVDSRVHEDIRQVSGYARLKKVYRELNINTDSIIDCLIIHPDPENGYENLKEVNLKEAEIQDYNRIYKVGIKLPVV
ncbi:McrC family protein [Aestuariivivens marinum]|uniref:McrC family protein n=1 Tax=Aestuariivivens marinum TaxID=2913555 RepID=UPI001F58BD61|nr:McrC family protein [Aestuariivivens marinum]